ncbi:MAG: GLPGLI family protein [Draconibacterium sp.]|nr:GLPGLI family protein [Draconibacterium sp.]
MKRSIYRNIFFISLTFAFTLTFAISFAQENTSGKVVYEEVMKLEIKLEGDAAQFAHMLPKERKSNKVLYFNQESSLYENKAKEEDETMSMSSGHANVMIKMAEPENKVFTDLESKKRIEQREFMTRTFLIADIAEQKWKMTGKQKMILDFPCQEATIEKDSIIYSAWFTPAIPVSAGPANYGGLPGLILAIESSDGKRSTTATSVEFAEVGKDLLSKPKKGKKVTRDEFDQIVQEKMKEMGAEHGGEGRSMMIRIHR